MPAQAEGVRVEPMTGEHAAAVLSIYQAGIDEGNATFETRAPEAAGIWTIQSGIFPENAASMALHRPPGSASSG